jgi:hypothetical protein
MPVFRLFRALPPLAMLRISKLIIDGVVAWITRRGGILAGHPEAAGAGIGGSTFARDVPGRARTPCGMVI